MLVLPYHHSFPEMQAGKTRYWQALPYGKKLCDRSLPHRHAGGVTDILFYHLDRSTCTYTWFLSSGWMLLATRQSSRPGLLSADRQTTGPCSTALEIGIRKHYSTAFSNTLNGRDGAGT